jgi:hypothetical protein
MPEKPSYLGLLNAIALGEGRAHRYLRAWAERTPDPDVRGVLMTVAIREGEHAMAFEKRLCELGFSVQDRPDPSFEKTLSLVTSSKTDLEKFEGLGYGKSGDADQIDDLFSRIFQDKTLDIQTGELLGRYIAEERDSGRRLRACYQALREGANGGSELRDDVRELCARVEALDASLEALRKEVAGLRSS